MSAMHALIATREGIGRGLLYCAFRHAGWQAREVFTTDEADRALRDLGSERCVLMLEPGLLPRQCGSATWAGFLARHPALRVVVTSETEVDEETRRSIGGGRGTVLEGAFDAAAVVSAAERLRRSMPASRRRGPAARAHRAAH
jgi:hypothetical protein